MFPEFCGPRTGPDGRGNMMTDNKYKGGKVLEASDGSILHSSDIPLDMMYASMEMGATKTIDEAISNLSKSGKFADEVKYLSELRDKGYKMKHGEK